MAGLEPERRLQQLRAQGIVAHVVFEHQRVRRMVGVRRGRQCGDEMAGRRQADRAAPDMRRHAQVAGVRQGGDAPGFGQAADGRDRGLHDVDAASVDQGAEVAHRVMRLAGGDRDRRAGAQFGVAQKIARRQRLLDPVDAERLDRAGAFQRHVGGVGAVDVDHQELVRPQRLARLAHALDVVPDAAADLDLGAGIGMAKPPRPACDRAAARDRSEKKPVEA